MKSIRCFSFLPRPLPKTIWPIITTRYVSMNHPKPLPLPTEDQREFEELLRKAQLTTDSNVDLSGHSDVHKPITPQFEGDVNPETGEQGGPKQEPVKQWGADSGGDWSFKGRVSDF